MKQLLVIVLVVALLLLAVIGCEPGLQTKPGPTATPTLRPPQPGDPTPTPAPTTSGVRYYRIRCYPGCHAVQKNPYTRAPSGYFEGQ